MENLFEYTDAKARKLAIVITTATLRRLSLQVKFAFDDILSSNVTEETAEAEVKKYQAFLNDDLRFAEVLYCILQPACEAAGIKSQEQFEEGLSGEANQKAISAFHAAFTDFSKGPRQSLLRAIGIQMQKQKKVEEIGLKRMHSEAEKLDDKKLEQLVNEKIDQRLSKPAGNLAEQSA